MIEIARYTDAHRREWDEFVTRSKNGTFLFLRDYMDHNRDRFPDHSLIARENGRPCALLPAAIRSESLITSHAGLTYGGVVTDTSMKMPRMLCVFDGILTQLKALGFRQFLYKTVPHIYHSHPAEEERYALQRCRAEWTRSGTLAVVELSAPLPYQERRCRAVNRAKRETLTVEASTDFPAFWAILTDLLFHAYGTQPLHSLAEITNLASTFPDHIRLFGCFQDRQMLGGVVIYETPRVARAQYIAATSDGKRIGALDLVFDHLLKSVYRDKRYFDFGTSEGDAGVINRGLIEQKEGFGARAISLDQYSLDLESWIPGSLAGALV